MHEDYLFSPGPDGNVGKFKRNIAATNKEKAFGEVLQVEKIFTIVDILCSRDRIASWSCPCCKNNMVYVEVGIVDLDGIRTRHYRFAMKGSDPFFLPLVHIGF